MGERTEVRTGVQVLDMFFGSLPDLDGMDPDTARLLSELHRSGDLTRDAILRSLVASRAARKEE